MTSRGLGRDEGAVVPVHLAHWGSRPLRVVRRKGSAWCPRPGVFWGGTSHGSCHAYPPCRGDRRKLWGGAEGAGVSRASIRVPLFFTLGSCSSFLLPAGPG